MLITMQQISNINTVETNGKLNPLILHSTYENNYLNRDKSPWPISSPGGGSWYCRPLLLNRYHLQEEFEDTKGVIRTSKSKKNRQHNGQKKRGRRTKNDLQNIH
jgi:hypothetical protein